MSEKYTASSFTISSINLIFKIIVKRVINQDVSSTTDTLLLELSNRKAANDAPTRNYQFHVPAVLFSSGLSSLLTENYCRDFRAGLKVMERIKKHIRAPVGNQTPAV